MTRSLIVRVLSAVVLLAVAGESLGVEPTSVRTVVDQFCVSCHDADVAKGGLNLDSVLSQEVAGHPQIWEKVVRRLRGRQMPPAGKKRPSEDAYVSLLAQIETQLD